jgi:hypothetical protein
MGFRKCSSQVLEVSGSRSSWAITTNTGCFRWQLPSIDNKRYFPIFPCVVGLIGY